MKECISRQNFRLEVPEIFGDPRVLVVAEKLKTPWPKVSLVIEKPAPVMVSIRAVPPTNIINYPSREILKAHPRLAFPIGYLLCSPPELVDTRISVLKFFSRPASLRASLRPPRYFILSQYTRHPSQSDSIADGRIVCLKRFR